MQITVRYRNCFDILAQVQSQVCYMGDNMMSTDKKKWSDDDIRQLISLYEQIPMLWNVKSVQYRDRAKKQENLQIIATKLATTQGEVTRKLHNLRSQFMQELKKGKNRKSGAGADENYNSSWPYFGALKFIQSTVEATPTINNLVSINNIVYLVKFYTVMACTLVLF
jgi:hypothetical protein